MSDHKAWIAVWLGSKRISKASWMELASRSLVSGGLKVMTLGATVGKGKWFRDVSKAVRTGKSMSDNVEVRAVNSCLIVTKSPTRILHDAEVIREPVPSIIQF